MSMDSELSDTNFPSTPKLALFSLHNHRPSESLTPPFQTPASVPFKWEEAPGKPRRSFSGEGANGEVQGKPKAARCLELPPGKFISTPSPSAVLEGTELGTSPKLSSFGEVLKGEGKFMNTPSPIASQDGHGPVLGPKRSSFRKMLKGESEIIHTPSPRLAPKLSSFRKMLKGEGEIFSTPSPNLVLDGPGSGHIVSKTMSFSFRKYLKGNGKITSTPSPSSVLDGPSPGPNITKTMSFSFRKFLKGDGKMTNTPSPGSVLDGPDPGFGPAVSQTMSFTFRNPEDQSLACKLVGKEKASFSSLRWGNEKGFEEEGESNFDFLSPVEGLEENGTRLRKRSGFWANIYKNVKQAVPWKRRQDKRRKINM